MTLTDFLLARIAEDEASAKIWGRTARELLECEAKRRIVAEHRNPEATDWCLRCVEHDGTDTLYPCPTLRALALPYADHPDYREDCKP